MVDAVADGPRQHGILRRIAGRDDVIPGVIRHTDGGDLRQNAGAGAGGVGQQDHIAALGAKAAQRRDGGGEGGLAIVQATPEIAEHRVIAG